MIRAQQANLPPRMEALLERGERWLRPADRLDNRFRRWLMPIRLEASRPRPHVSVRRSKLLTELQAEIGRLLRAQYEIAQPIPRQLADLLREYERGASAPARIA